MLLLLPESISRVAGHKKQFVSVDQIELARAAAGCDAKAVHFDRAAAFAPARERLVGGSRLAVSAVRDDADNLDRVR